LSKKLRIGLLIDTFSLPAWGYRLVELIRQSDHSDIALVIVNQSAARPTRDHSFQNSSNTEARCSIWRTRSSRTQCSKVNPDALLQRNADDLLAGIPTLNVTPIQRGFIDEIDPRDIEHIAKRRSGRPGSIRLQNSQGDILTVARCGIWSTIMETPRLIAEGRPGSGKFSNTNRYRVGVADALRRTRRRTRSVPLVFGNRWLSVKTQSQLLLLEIRILHPEKIERAPHARAERFMAKAICANDKPTFYSHKLYKAPQNLEFSDCSSGTPFAMAG